MANPSKARRVKQIALLTSAIIGMAAVGFIIKIVEFVRSLDDTSAMGFAVVPLSSYFLTGFGFLCLLVWSMSRGAFRDIEEPKYRMMRMEQQYARDEGDENPEWNEEA